MLSGLVLIIVLERICVLMVEVFLIIYIDVLGWSCLRWIVKDSFVGLVFMMIMLYFIVLCLFIVGFIVLCGCVGRLCVWVLIRMCIVCFCVLCGKCVVLLFVIVLCWVVIILV